jgi:uncharacterized protein YyaL (SSP411 family)
MRDPDGGFYATLDADSEGEEGRFYCFSREEFESLLDADEHAAAGVYYGFDQPANFDGHSWHLQPRSRALPFGAATAPVESARRKLLAAREQRVRPGRDEKILTAWNGLIIGNLARAARYLDRPDLGLAAQQTVDFLRENLWRDRRLFASYKDGRARFAGYLDDYAFLAFGLTELLQWQFRGQDLEFAVELADGLLEHFADPAGGFFFTANDHEQLIHRPKPLADEAVPSGNGIAALVLGTLGHLLGDSRYLKAAARTVDYSLAAMASHPEGHATLLKALDRQLEAPELIVVRGDDESLAAWRDAIDTCFNPRRQLFFIPDSVERLPGLLQSRAAGGMTTAYLCRGVECLAPIQDLDELLARINTPPGDRRSSD